MYIKIQMFVCLEMNLLSFSPRFAEKGRKAKKQISESFGETNDVVSPRRKKVRIGSDMVVNEMITTVEFKKQCDAGILHYGKKGQHQNRKHLETILGVG